jgi:hypothetical protein
MSPSLAIVVYQCRLVGTLLNNQGRLVFNDERLDTLLLLHAAILYSLKKACFHYTHQGWTMGNDIVSDRFSWG